MNIILELKKHPIGLAGKEIKDELFYKYDIEGTKVWFTQHLKTGNIYSVSISLPEHLSNIACLYVDCDSHSAYYPSSVDISLCSNKINISLDAYSTDFPVLSEYIKNLEYLKELSLSILEIFKDSEHESLYMKNNGLK